MGGGELRRCILTGTTLGRHVAGRFAVDLAVCLALASVLWLALRERIGAGWSGHPVWSLATPLCLLAAEWTRWSLDRGGERVAAWHAGVHPVRLVLPAAGLALWFVLVVAVFGSGSRAVVVAKDARVRAVLTDDGGLALLGERVRITWSPDSAWPAARTVDRGVGHPEPIAVSSPHQAFLLRSPLHDDGDGLCVQRICWSLLGPLGVLMLLATRSVVMRVAPWCGLLGCVVAL